MQMMLDIALLLWLMVSSGDHCFDLRSNPIQNFPYVVHTEVCLATYVGSD